MTIHDLHNDQATEPAAHHEHHRADGYAPGVRLEAVAVGDDAIELCAQPAGKVPDLSDVTDPERAEAILLQQTKWVSGTTLRYHLFSGLDPTWPGAAAFTWGGDSDQRDVVRWAFDRWKEQGIGLDFLEVGSAADAEIRIGFAHGDGSWSYLGRQILEHGRSDRRTMNFGWDLTTDYGRDTALHEIGHTLGMPHEHQNPNAGIAWDNGAVIDRWPGRRTSGRRRRRVATSSTSWTRETCSGPTGIAIR